MLMVGDYRFVGCINFVSTTENRQELAISYWPSQEHIKKWHNDPVHKQAQALGKAKWYKNYQVQITEVKTSHGN